MSAPTDTSAAPGAAQGAAEALTLLDALARAPAAAALVVAALERTWDRKALRLAHPQLRDAVDEATTKLAAGFEPRLLSFSPAARPTPRRWPHLEELALFLPDLAALEALGSGIWGALRALSLMDDHRVLTAPAARALAAALRRLPALRELSLVGFKLPEASGGEFVHAFSADAAPQLRSLAVSSALGPAAARAVAASGWRLEELNLSLNPRLGAAGLAALVAAPTFGDADGPALAALSRHARLRKLNLKRCNLSAAGFAALVEAAWPALTSLCVHGAWNLRAMEFEGPHAPGAAAFTGFPALEELDLSWMELREAGAALLASRRWARLRVLSLRCCRIGDAGVAALARGEWPALQRLDVYGNRLGAPLELEEARLWAPALVELQQLSRSV